MLDKVNEFFSPAYCCVVDFISTFNLEKLCEAHQYTIQGAIAIFMFLSVVISLWFALKKPLPKIKAEVDLVFEKPNKAAVPFYTLCKEEKQRYLDDNYEDISNGILQGTILLAVNVKNISNTSTWVRNPLFKLKLHKSFFASPVYVTYDSRERHEQFSESLTYSLHPQCPEEIFYFRLDEFFKWYNSSIMQKYDSHKAQIYICYDSGKLAKAVISKSVKKMMLALVKAENKAEFLASLRKVL